MTQAELPLPCPEFPVVVLNLTSQDEEAEPSRLGDGNRIAA